MGGSEKEGISVYVKISFLFFRRPTAVGIHFSFRYHEVRLSFELNLSF